MPKRDPAEHFPELTFPGGCAVYAPELDYWRNPDPWDNLPDPHPIDHDDDKPIEEE